MRYIDCGDLPSCPTGNVLAAGAERRYIETETLDSKGIDLLSLVTKNLPEEAAEQIRRNAKLAAIQRDVSSASLVDRLRAGDLSARREICHGILLRTRAGGFLCKRICGMTMEAQTHRTFPDINPAELDI